MKNYWNKNIILLTIILFICNSIFHAEQDTVSKKLNGAYHSGVYQNLIKELLSISEFHIKEKIDSMFNQLFYGDDDSERIYYPVSPDMAYILDINNNDVRTEGISYGLMITVQMNKKDEFDRLWKWAKTYMQHKEGKYKDYFAWHCKTSGEIIDSNSASDGEEWIVTTLFFASARWGDGEGIFDYRKEAQIILNAMLNKAEFSDDPQVVTNIFNKKEKQVVFVPTGNADNFTDPSYHVPHFYELWAEWADSNNEFWLDAARTSREYFKKTAHPITGLMPDYSDFQGNPVDPWKGGHNNFVYDAWRVAMNVAIDYEWFEKDSWAVEQSNRLLNFFYSKGVHNYGHSFTLEGKQLLSDHSTGLVAMNAVACLASNLDIRKEFVAELWNSSILVGKYRYYDGILYMLGLLQVSGNFQIYNFN